jgi:Reverse transcriptase (RNA-dependent DNA polymerase)
VDQQVKLDLSIGGHYEMIIFDVAPLGGHNMVLGLLWLRRHNPQVNWEEAKLLFSSPYCLGSCVEGKAEIVLEMDRRGLGIIEMSEDEVRIYSVDFKAEFLEDPRELKKQVPEPYWDYLAIFDSGRAMAKLPPLRGGDGDFGIQFVEGAKLPRPAKPYPLSQRELGVLDEWLKRLEEVGTVVPALVDCPIAAPLFFVPKKEGTLRPVIDYQKLNEITVKDAYPLPRIDQLMDEVNGCDWFTKLDLKDGYHQIRMKPEDIWKTCFTTPRGNRCMTVATFGFCNMPPFFQRFMNKMLELVMYKMVSCYMDDILTRTSGGIQVHITAVKRTLELLGKAGLYAKISKCEFHKEKLEFLGVEVSKDGFEMSPKKVEDVLNWKAPTKVRGVREFIRFCNFY